MRLILLCAMLLGGCATPGVSQQPVVESVQTTQAQPPGGRHPMFRQPGYLSGGAGLDLGPLIGAPPDERSPRQAHDDAVRDRVLPLKNTPRYRLAQIDADLRAPNPPGLFSCAVGGQISVETAPQTHALLMRAAIDFARSTSAVKAQYQRTRPFAAHDAVSCTPEEDEMLRGNGSFPSGHTALGWGWALLLAELKPERADQILLRGHEFGQSRVVCDVHWQSDVDGGRIAASAVFARLHADPQFRADLEAARAELADGPLPAPDRASCEAESAALALSR